MAILSLKGNQVLPTLMRASGRIRITFTFTSLASSPLVHLPIQPGGLFSFSSVIPSSPSRPSTQTSTRFLHTTPTHNNNHNHQHESFDPTDSYLIGPTEPALIEDTLYHHWSTKILPAYHSNLALISKSEAPADSQRFSYSDNESHGASNLRSSGECLRLSYAELDRRIGLLAAGLRQLGIRKGDRVGIYTENHSIYPTLQFATAKLGAILMTINPNYQQSELMGVLKKVNCKILFSNPSSKSVDKIPLLSTLLTESESQSQLSANDSRLKIIMVDNESHRVSYQSGLIEGVESEINRARSQSKYLQRFDQRFVQDGSVLELEQILGNFESFQAQSRDGMENKSEEQEEESLLDADEIVNLQFTSGTTGLPKAVSLTHRNLLNNANQIANRMRLSSIDRFCNPPPMFHCLGLVCGNLTSFLRGATLVIPSDQGFDPNLMIQSIVQERCTALNGVNTMFLAGINALDRIGKVDLSSLRTGIVAGSPVSVDLMRLIESRLGIKQMTILYGMTETSPGSFQTEPSDDFQKRTTTVGKILPNLRAKVVDLDSRQVVKRGEKGELLVSGYALQKGYWADPEETEKAMIKDQDGRVWMKSGDLAIMDSDGYLQIVGRAKDVIIRGGENLFPVAIEKCINALDGVMDVAVIGIADEFYGEVVGAFVKRSKEAIHVTIETIRDEVKKQMSTANVPKYVWFLDSIGRPDFPMTGSGKIKKTELRTWAQELIEKI